MFMQWSSKDFEETFLDSLIWGRAGEFSKICKKCQKIANIIILGHFSLHNTTREIFERFDKTTNVWEITGIFLMKIQLKNDFLLFSEN